MTMVKMKIYNYIIWDCKELSIFLTFSLKAEMQKSGDTGDISLLFFLAGANFWAILGHFWAILAILSHFWQLWLILGNF